jgi:hypothetical protein
METAENVCKNRQPFSRKLDREPLGHKIEILCIEQRRFQKWSSYLQVWFLEHMHVTWKWLMTSGLPVLVISVLIGMGNLDLIYYLWASMKWHFVKDAGSVDFYWPSDSPVTTEALARTSWVWRDTCQAGVKAAYCYASAEILYLGLVSGASKFGASGSKVRKPQVSRASIDCGNGYSSFWG